MSKVLTCQEFMERYPFREDHDYENDTIVYEYNKFYKLQGKSFEETSMYFKSMSRPDGTMGYRDDPINKQYLFYKWLIGYLYKDYVKKSSVSLMDEIKQGEKAEPMKYIFMTIGWDDNIITESKMLTLSQRVANLAIFKNSNISYVLEKHRQNGIHHHTHYLIKTPLSIGRKAILQKIGQIAEIYKYTKENFIDIEMSWQRNEKPMPSYEKLNNYIKGIKTEAKMEFVNLDDEWRSQNQIEKLYTLR